MISADKAYRTRAGQPARVYATDGPTEWPIHGAVFHDNEWHMKTWTRTGNFGRAQDHDLDLVEIRPRIKRTFWLNIHGSGYACAYGYPTKLEADRDGGMTRGACVEINIDVEEGHGLSPAPSPKTEE